MARLPSIAELDATSSGSGYFLCVRKERRTGRGGGAFLAMQLQDATGEIGAKLFQDVESFEPLFDAGDFVAVQGKGNLYHQRLEVVVDRIRRVTPEDERLGFREEDCIRSSPRPVDEMWQELLTRIDSVTHPCIRLLLMRVVQRHEQRLRVWPAARQVHHAYRGGLLEHVLKIVEVSVLLADAYGARRDLVIAGAILHDLGKLEELVYAGTIEYSVAGNLLGHIVIGAGMARDEIRGIPDFPAELALEIEHLVLSHHGSRELGSPVVPVTIEAMILSAVDDFDAKMQQVRQHLASDDSEGRFTAYHRNLERVLLKP
jgi:3'-5' exoribonuclease